MTDRRDFVRAALMAVLFPCAANAQQSKKIARIGFLSSRSVEVERSWLAAFQQGLGALGYWEAKNIVIEQRYAEARYERIPELLAELIRLKVDVLVALGDPAVHAAKKASSTIPIVMVTSPDPVGTGLVASLARPGGSVTGLSDFHADLMPKRLEFLKEIVPSVSRVAVLWNPASPSHPRQLKDLQAAAPAYRVTLLPLGINGPDEIEHAFAAIGKERPGGLLVIGDPVLVTHRKRIAELALKNRLPAIATLLQFAEAGFLITYGANFADLYRRAATYVDKILKGAKPADLPVERPVKFDLVINLKTAKALGVTVPRSLLLRADQVIE